MADPVKLGPWPERDPHALALFAAWVNCPVDKLPDTMKGHTCEATMQAWARVARASEQFMRPRMVVADDDTHPAKRQGRIGGLREAAKLAHGKTVQEHYVEWPWWGPGNRSQESELAVFSKHLNDAILARASEIEKGEA